MYCVLSVCVLCIECMCIVYRVYVHCVLSVCALCIECTCIVYYVCVYWFSFI